MAEDVMLQEAIEAIRQGQRVRARDLLARLLRTDQSNPEYWLWMSSVVDTTKEQVYCLQSVLRLEPNNSTALQGLVLLGARTPEGEVAPVPPIHRKWDVEMQDVPELTGFRAFLAHPVVRILTLIILTVAVVGLIGVGIYAGVSRPQRVAAVIPTNTPGPTPTLTYTPTALNETLFVPTSTPTQAGPPPLSARLKATYTPTPVYVNTPHPANESFGIAKRSLARGNLDAAFSNFQQAMQMEPTSADIPYYVGEIYRQQGNFQLALDYYRRSIAINPNFAPAYLGIARASQALDPKADISGDLDNAIEKDASYGEAYLERASYMLSQGDTDAAGKDLEQAEALMPGSPLIYLYQAQIDMAEGDMKSALENARKANQLDQTMLLSYRLLSEAASANNLHDEALEAIDVYLTYEQNDPLAWMIRGKALYVGGQFTETLEAADYALKLDKNLAQALLYRGLAYLELGEAQKALNDIFAAKSTNPQSFQMNLVFGRALLAANHLAEALGQIDRAKELAHTDADMAQVYFWRAQTLEKIGNVPSALKDWKALLALPEDAMPPEWRQLAEEHIQATVTPQPPTLTPTRTPKPSLTPTLTRTPKPSLTPTYTRTPRPTTPRATSTLPSISSGTPSPAPVVTATPTSR